jgi:hypothetical protein
MAPYKTQRGLQVCLLTNKWDLRKCATAEKSLHRLCCINRRMRQRNLLEHVRGHTHSLKHAHTLKHAHAPAGIHSLSLTHTHTHTLSHTHTYTHKQTKYVQFRLQFRTTAQR